MSRQRHELKIYHNQQLMDDTNWMFVWIKKYIHCKDKFPNTPPPPIEKLDELMSRIFTELRKDSEPMIKR